MRESTLQVAYRNQDCCFVIHQRNIQSLATDLFKVKQNISTHIMNNKVLKKTLWNEVKNCLVLSRGIKVDHMEIAIKSLKIEIPMHININILFPI